MHVRFPKSALAGFRACIRGSARGPVRTIANEAVQAGGTSPRNIWLFSGRSAEIPAGIAGLGSKDASGCFWRRILLQGPIEKPLNRCRAGRESLSEAEVIQALQKVRIDHEVQIWLVGRRHLTLLAFRVYWLAVQNSRIESNSIS
jgi:hypothetical protein